MPAVTHPYPVSISWSGGRDGNGRAQLVRSGVGSHISVPAELGGAATGTNPEELLTASIGACYSITFGIIAANRKLPVEKIEVEAVGEVEQDGVALTYKRITLNTKISVSQEVTPGQRQLILEMAHKAEAYCLITNAVRKSVEISVIASIIGT